MVKEVSIDDIIREARFTGSHIYDGELLRVIVFFISAGRLTPEEAKKVGEIRSLAYEQTRKKIKEAI